MSRLAGSGARLDGDPCDSSSAQTEANPAQAERDYTRQLELSQKAGGKTTAENVGSTSMRCAPYDSAKLELSYTDIRAPIRAWSPARATSRSATRSPNDLTFRRDANPRPAGRLRACREKEFRKLAPGGRSTQVDAIGERFAARIARISPTVDPQTGTFPRRIEVPDPRGT